MSLQVAKKIGQFEFQALNMLSKSSSGSLRKLSFLVNQVR